VIRTVVFIIAFSLCIKAVWAGEEISIKGLRDALVALAPDVDPGEAELVSVTAHTTEHRLAHEYRMVWFPGFQNLLIHTGRRQRGYCGDFARDIGERLKELRLKTLVLHWGSAYAGTPIEDNALVVTARNQPFEKGIIMDGWRDAPQLFWCPLKKDTAYRRTPNIFLQRSADGRALDNSTAWQEAPVHTAWLQDYTHKWQWKRAAQ
jgi:hypothetical protein